MSSRHSRSSPSRDRRKRERSRSRSRSRERERRKRDPSPKAREKKLSLAEQKEQLRLKKEALLKKKGVEPPVAVAVKQEILPSLQGKVQAGDGPIPLILDDQGRQVDLQGRLVSGSTSKAHANKSLLINKRVEREKVYGDKKKDDTPKVGGIYDNRLGPAAQPRQKKKGFRFIEAGSLVRKADRARAEQKLEDLNKQLQEGGQEINPDLVLEMKMGMNAINQERDVVPDFEWWDIALVGEDDFEPTSVKDIESRALKRVNNLLEHPKEVSGLKPEPKEVAVPLMLTPDERKRMQREERVAKQEALRAQITLGIIPPPPPKVKLSNMERVYGQRMVENPTAVEQEVRKAMQDRLTKHLLDNEKRKLTPTQKREKKLKAVIQDRKEELRAVVFRVDDFSSSKNLWKVQTNAKQVHCTGTVVTHSSMNVCVFEGGPKAIKFMKKLMLRRINWNEEDEEGEGEGSSKNVNKCVLVWEGVVARPAFQRMDVEHTESDVAAARKIFDDAKVVHYWDLARSHEADEVQLQQAKNFI